MPRSVSAGKGDPFETQPGKIHQPIFAVHSNSFPCSILLLTNYSYERNNLQIVSEQFYKEQF